MRILLTGATGFVGTGLLPRLLAESRFQVRVAVRRDLMAVCPGVEQVVLGQLLDVNLSQALTGVDVVVHLAARVHVMQETSVDPLMDFRVANVANTLRLAREAAAVGVKRFIFMSSVKVNGESGSFSEGDAPSPRDAYGVSKLEAEIGLRRIAEETGMAVTIIRPPLVYGPNVKANFRALMRAVSRGVPLPLGAVNNRRSLVALDNLVDFICACIHHPAAANETFFVSDGEDLSTTDLVRRLASTMGRSARLIPVPSALIVVGATLLGRRAAAQRLVGSLQLDITKARRILGWTPPISVDEGLRRAASAFNRP